MVNFNWLPFTNYPVRAQYREQKIIPILFVGAVVTYLALTVWNVLTQGYNNVFTTVLLPTFTTNNDKIKCSPVQLSVGSSLYTQPQGTFNWALNAVTNNLSSTDFHTGFGYKGDPLQCNITSIGITYSYGGQTFQYGVCANCTVPGTPLISASNMETDIDDAININSKDDDLIIGLCTNFDQSFSNLPSWTKAGQQTVQNAIYGFSTFLPLFNFANDTFSEYRWPPYGGPGPKAPSWVVTPAQVSDLSVWMGGFRFMHSNLTETGFNGTFDFGANHAVYIPSLDKTTDLVEAYNYTADPSLSISGEILTIFGIGGLSINNYVTGSLPPQPESPVIGELRNKSIGISSLVMEQALGDLQNRNLVSSYLCTVKSKEWKNFWTVLAVVLGNNAALFGSFLFVAQYLAERIDLQRHGPPTITVHPSSFTSTTLPSRSAMKKQTSLTPFKPPVSASDSPAVVQRSASSSSIFKPPISYSNDNSPENSLFYLPRLEKEDVGLMLKEVEEKRFPLTEEPDSMNGPYLKRNVAAPPSGPRPLLNNADNSVAPAYSPSPETGSYVINPIDPLPSPGEKDEIDFGRSSTSLVGGDAGKGKVQVEAGSWDNRWNYESVGGGQSGMEQLSRQWSVTESEKTKRGGVSGFIKNFKASQSRDKLL